MSSKILLQLALLTYIANVISEDKYLLVKVEVPQENEDKVPAVATGDELPPIENPNGWNDLHSIKEPNSVDPLGKVAFRKNKVKKGGKKKVTSVQIGIQKAKKAANAVKNLIKGML